MTTFIRFQNKHGVQVLIIKVDGISEVYEIRASEDDIEELFLDTFRNYKDAMSFADETKGAVC